MSVNRDELLHLIEGMPDDQVEVLLTDARRLASSVPESAWPPRFFGIGESNNGRADNARRVDEILAEGFGARRS